MVVDFELKKSPKYRVASLNRKGPRKPDHLRAEFRTLVAWAKKGRVRTGRWIFVHGADDHFLACLEVLGAARPEGPIRMRTLAATMVASVTFDPDQVSPRIVYHGLNDWLRWRRREKKIRRVGSSREVYSGDPWTNPRAWARCEVQFIVRT
jgi:DNA gyrase inhibitor GyrI